MTPAPVRLPCATERRVLWFGADNEKKNARRDREALARAACAGCPQRVECLDGALETKEQHGIWGGVRMTGEGPERVHLLAVGRHDLVVSMGHKRKVPVSAWAWDMHGCRCEGCRNAKATEEAQRQAVKGWRPTPKETA